MNKNFLKIIINDGVVTVATQTFNLFLIWYFAVKLHRQDMVALLGTLQIIGIVGGPVGGAVADMVNPAKILKWVSLIRIFVTSILFFSLFQTHTNIIIWLLLIFSTLNSLISVFYASAVEVSTYKFAKNESERVKNNAGFSAVSEISSILSGSLLAIMITYLDLKSSTILIIFLIILSVIGILNISTAKNIIPDVINNSDVNFKFNEAVSSTFKGLRNILHEPIIQTVIPYALIMNFLYWTFWYIQPLYLNYKIPNIKYAFSLQQIVISVASVIATIVIQRKHTLVMNYKGHYRLLLLIQSGALFLLSLLYAFINSEKILITGLICFWALYSLFNSFTGIILITLLQEKIDNKILGTTLGTIFTLLMVTAPLAAIASKTVPIKSISLIILTGLMVVSLLYALTDKRFLEVLHDD
ncbi:MFS transporter [Leuconostoc carnosum]|uniref:MFS transporter n=1 Tax=Leuconostoc TaxID=1243 RepID=UPI000D50FB0C|nr:MULTISPECIES: MFS transporter [Leuconostoc]KAA8324544.1 MFS transporter [Leuconostoc carnosum]KAA8358217.1 MFS transporter [Leuconostoc carnosum]KAA8364715.1 MFS transporter [Leuconostoc carnosum]KAA8365588.1 MFS transporter [Leuconostoc carnosum]KAA8371616.1 MFS transporter [Leuconostoc carnosum]